MEGRQGRIGNERCGRGSASTLRKITPGCPGMAPAAKVPRAASHTAGQKIGDGIGMTQSTPPQRADRAGSPSTWAVAPMIGRVGASAVRPTSGVEPFSRHKSSGIMEWPVIMSRHIKECHHATACHYGMACHHVTTYHEMPSYYDMSLWNDLSSRHDIS